MDAGERGGYRRRLFMRVRHGGTRRVPVGGPDGTGVAVQSTPYVGPGQVGWFVVHFRARAELGTYNVQLVPRIDGRGPLTNLGIYAVVTVSKNP